jgi:hypothetical protein
MRHLRALIESIRWHLGLLMIGVWPSWVVSEQRDPEQQPSSPSVRLRQDDHTGNVDYAEYLGLGH